MYCKMNTMNSVETNETNNEDAGLQFGYESEIHESRMNEYKENVGKQINIVSKALENNVKEARDQFGAVIINANKENLWFSRNVAFIFGIGSIYDEEDELIMNTLLSFFDNNNENGFLMNHYQIESYDKSSLIQEIERKLKIANGNYHVFMVPVVYANEDELNDAPEYQFTKRGIVQKFMKWDNISKYMRQLMTKYGLITSLDRQHDAYSWEIGNEGLSVNKSNKQDVECKFDIDVDPDGTALDEIDKNLAFQRDLHDDYNNRIRKGKASRDGRFSIDTDTRSKRKTLYAQIHEEKVNGIPINTMPQNSVKGVEMRLNETFGGRTQNNFNKKPEFQLFTDNSTFVENKNVMDLDVENRDKMPRFRQTNVRGSKTRTPTMGTRIEVND